MVSAQIARDIERRREQEQADQARILATLAEKEKAREQRAEEKKKAPLIRSMEHLGAKREISSAECTLNQIAAKQVQITTLAKAEVDEEFGDFSEVDGGAALKDDVASRLGKANDAAEAAYSKVTEASGARWALWKEEGKDAQYFHDLKEQVVREKKTAAEHEVFKELRDATKAFSNIKDKMKKEVLEAEKNEQRSAMAKNQITNAPQKVKAGELLPQKKRRDVEQALAADGNADVHASGGPLCAHGVQFAVSDDLLKVDKASVILIGAERTGSIAKKIIGLDYYKVQKGWLVENMNDTQQKYTVGAIAKPANLRQIKTSLKVFTELAPIETPPVSIASSFQPGWLAVLPGGYHFQMANNMCLLGVKLVLEGSAVLYAIPTDVISGATIVEKAETVEKMDATAMEALAQKEGVFIDQTPNSMLAIPPRYATLVLNLSKDAECHGIRWQIFGSDKTRAASHELLKTTLAELPAMNTGSHKELLKHLNTLAGLAV